jgi:hypothetical protein
MWVARAVWGALRPLAAPGPDSGGSPPFPLFSAAPACFPEPGIFVSFVAEVRRSALWRCRRAFGWFCVARSAYRLMLCITLGGVCASFRSARRKKSGKFEFDGKEERDCAYALVLCAVFYMLVQG